jgi:L-2,4-diaminobutyrate decarboxylase
MIMALWVLWAVYGRALFAEKIEHLCHMTEAFHRILLDEPDFETLHRPESNILCFRYRPAELEDEDVHRLQVTIRNRIKRQGDFFISKVNIDGVAALRVVVMNHQTDPDHFRMLMGEVRRVARDLVGSSA